MAAGLWLSALFVGLIGSGTHCLGMCGGIMGALSVNIRRDGRSACPYLLAYNLGRVMSYTLAGAVLGGLGHGLVAAVPGAAVASLGDRIAALFMVALGLFLGGWWRVLGRLEAWGARGFAYIRPLGERLMPVTRLPQALALGVLWGFLPCGLVYSVLAWALASGSALKGAALMAIFGLATAPGLLTLGGTQRLALVLRKRSVRQALAALVVVYGLVSFVTPLA